MKKVLVLVFGLAVLVALGCGGEKDCCKWCEGGKACGDTCIARDAVCRKSGGCACSAAAGEE